MLDLVLIPIESDTLWSGGYSINGAAGIGTVVTTQVVDPYKLSGWKHIEISGGYNISAVIMEDGSLWTCGRGLYGATGHGDTDNRGTLEQVGSSKWAKVSAGNGHMLGIKDDNALWAWGRNNFGQLGNDDAAVDQHSPVVIDSGSWVMVSAGSGFSYGIKSNGTLWAWGLNNSGQLGQGNTTDLHVPTQVGTDTDWSFVSAAVGGFHVLAIKTAGTLWACGRNDHYQLGLGTGMTDGSYSTFNECAIWAYSSSTTFVQAAAGTDHSVALGVNGYVYTAGRGLEGQLGRYEVDIVEGGIIGLFEKHNFFAHVSTNTAISIGAGHKFSLKVRANGQMWGFGLNDEGQLISGSTSAQVEEPAKSNDGPWEKIATGYQHTLMIKE